MDIRIVKIRAVAALAFVLFIPLNSPVAIGQQDEAQENHTLPEEVVTTAERSKHQLHLQLRQAEQHPEFLEAVVAFANKRQEYEAAISTSKQ